MIVLDANVLIAHFDPGHVHHAEAGRLLSERPVDGFAMSTITIAEVLTGAGSDSETHALATDIKRLGIQELSLPAGSATSIAVLRRQTGLPIPDCILIASVQLPGGKGQHSLATFDARLAGKARGLGIAVTP